MPGISITREPAARTAWPKPIVRTPEPLSTESTLGEENVPTPRTTVTLRCLASAVSPEVSRSTTDDLKPRSLSTSIEGVPNDTPCEARNSASAITRAVWSRAFDGMQPTFKQTPPSFSCFSTRTTDKPRSAARKAAV